MMMMVVMAVPMIVAVAVFVVMIVMMVMTIMRVTMPVIGAMHRLERSDCLAHRRAQAFQHRAQHVIAADQDAQGLDLDLRLEVAVAEVPGKLGKVQNVARDHLKEFFLLGNDLDLTAVFQDEAVTVGEEHWLGQVDEDGLTAVQRDALAAQVPLVLREANGGRGGPKVLPAADVG